MRVYSQVVINAPFEKGDDVIKKTLLSANAEMAPEFLDVAIKKLKPKFSLSQIYKVYYKSFGFKSN